MSIFSKIPGILDQRPLSYGWEGNDEVVVFTSSTPLPEFKIAIRDWNDTIEEFGDDTSLNCRYLDDSKNQAVYQILAATINNEQETDFDLVSYVGEDQFTELKKDGAVVIGAFFKLTPGGGYSSCAPSG